jgi:hypothetical protein
MNNLLLSIDTTNGERQREKRKDGKGKGFSQGAQRQYDATLLGIAFVFVVLHPLRGYRCLRK